MVEHILFLTGKLAEKRLHRILVSMQATDFSYEVRNLGVSVAALMTAGMIKRRLRDIDGVSRIIVPGLCRGDLDAVSAKLNVPIICGPDDLKDLPGFFGRDCQPVDLTGYDVTIFAEIVEAPQVDVAWILARARRYADDGADVIDIGCLPDTDFPHLEDAIKALKQEGFKVSVDSMLEDELLRGAKAGADYLLSLNESTLWIADEVDSIPIIIPEKHGDLTSLYRAIDTLGAGNRRFIADSILGPIHFGFSDSLHRYHRLRKRYPDIEIMMGVGNITELTEADTSGMNAILFGVCSELGINNVLCTEVSPHACSAVREADMARRIMYAAKKQQSLPKGLDNSLLTTHARKPFPYTSEEIAELSQEVRDPNYRVQVSEEGIHVFNRDGMHIEKDPFAIFTKLALLEDDAPHAFYMGVELAKAQIAWQLGKNYMQDEELKWGAAVKSANTAAADGTLKLTHQFKAEGSTLKASRNRKKKHKAS